MTNADAPELHVVRETPADPTIETLTAIRKACTDTIQTHIDTGLIVTPEPHTLLTSFTNMLIQELAMQEKQPAEAPTPTEGEPLTETPPAELPPDNPAPPTETEDED